MVSAAAVQTLGVLRLGLATVAGQTTGALVIDLIAPAPGEAVTVATVLGVVLTMVAVAISGRGPAARRRRRPPGGLARPGTLPAMPSARAQRSSWPAAQGLLGGLAELAEALRAPRGVADELDEARELLAYWEQRARRLPRWAVMRRREARAMALALARARAHGRAGPLRPRAVGAASQLAVERRMPTTLAHRGRQAARVAAYAAVTAALTLLLVFAPTIARGRGRARRALSAAAPASRARLGLVLLRDVARLVGRRGPLAPTLSSRGPYPPPTSSSPGAGWSALAPSRVIGAIAARISSARRGRRTRPPASRRCA